MRTGIIHITGLAATLGFILAIMVWVYGQVWDHGVFAGIKGPPVITGIQMQHGRAELSYLTYDDTYLQWHAGVVRTDMVKDMWDPPPLHFRQFSLAINHPVSTDTTLWAVTVPQWFLIATFTLPTVIYLRFLRRRKRHPSVDDDSASSDDSDASGLAGSAAES